MEYRLTDSSELQNCPAAVDLDTGILLINRDVWNMYDKLQQKFIIEHEIAHYKNPNFTEIEADRVALHKVAGLTDKSLQKAITTLFKVGVTDDARLEALYIEALKIDAQHGNQEAAKELAEIEGFERSFPMPPALPNTFKKISKMENITICGYEISITNILLASILLVLLNRR